MENKQAEAVEITITARDARGNTATYEFEFTPRKPGVAEAVDDLKHGFIGQIDNRITPVRSEQ